MCDRSIELFSNGNEMQFRFKQFYKLPNVIWGGWDVHVHRNESLHGGNACYLVVRKCQRVLIGSIFSYFFTARQLCKHSNAPYVSAYYNTLYILQVLLDFNIWLYTCIIF